jgi:ABC-2 type transport system permease protein
MSTLSPTVPAIAIRRPLPVRAPSFAGLVRGEIFKIARQRTTWITLILLAGLSALPWVALPLLAHARADIQNAPLPFLYRQMSGALSTFRVFAGFAVIILTARIVGLDYQQGTVRIVLARGVERLQFLGAKLAAIGLIIAALLIGALTLNLVLMVGVVGPVMGLGPALTDLTGYFWHGAGIYALTVLISMAATALMAVAVTVIGRSLNFGLAAGMSFFPADNIGVLVCAILANITQSTFWVNLTGYFLGPNLNIMPQLWVPPIQVTEILKNGQAVQQVREVFSFGNGPLMVVDVTHTIVVTAIWALAFAVTALVLTQRRDVLE